MVVQFCADAGGVIDITRYAYDDDGNQCKRLDINGTIHYGCRYGANLDNAQATATTVVTTYYAAVVEKMSKVVALRKGNTFYLVGSDHLGGTMRVTDASVSAVD